MISRLFKKILSKKQPKTNSPINSEYLHIYNYIKNNFGVEPNDISKYRLALIHKSYTQIPGENNERLEFLGDAVLDLIISEYLYFKYPDKLEGTLTAIRSKIVRRSVLNLIGKNLNISENMILGDGLEKNKIKYLEGNVLESIIGAIYLDQGYEKTQNIVINKIFKLYLNQNLSNIKEYKCLLYEWAQKNKREISFKLIDKHDINNGTERFAARLHIDGELMTESVGSTKKEAEEKAAEVVMTRLN